MFNNNSLGDLCSAITAATLPFITLGFLGDNVVLYISISIGILSLIGLVLSMLCKNNKRAYCLLKPLFKDFSLPYALTLSSLILKNNGIDATIGLWISAILCILTVLTNLIYINSKGN